MPGRSIKIPSREGGEFDCYLNVPDAAQRLPALVLASAVHGVDADIVAIADELAEQGCIAAAPDLFWRTLPGPLSHEDGRAQQRSQPRLERIKQGEADMADTLAWLRQLPPIQRKRGRNGTLLRGTVRDSRTEPTWLRCRPFLPWHSNARLSARTRGCFRPCVHSLGRSRSSGAGGGVERLSRPGVTKGEYGAAYLSRRPARLHDARHCEGV